MKERGLDFDICFTSFQTRAIKTLHLALEAMGRLWLPEEKGLAAERAPLWRPHRARQERDEGTPRR
jgi:bisphosphoglycerate-dependent phosphoglycerate mutase